MKKELGVNPYLFPMPVLMIATYSDGDVVNVMNMAWGGICADNMVSLNIEEDRKTSENIKKHGAFAEHCGYSPYRSRRFLWHCHGEQDAGQVRAKWSDRCEK